MDTIACIVVHILAKFDFGSAFYCFRKEPDLELQGLFKRHFTQVEFFQGTVMNAVDLERCCVSIFRFHLSSLFFAILYANL